MSLNPKASLDAVLRRMVGKLHHHCCTACRLRYSCACRTPVQNRQCQACREVRRNRRPRWDCSTDPADCCGDNCDQLTDTALFATYGLAGPGPWFRCRTCRRIHGFYPRRGS